MNYGFVNGDNRLYVSKHHHLNPIKVTNPFHLNKISETCFKLKNILNIKHHEFSDFHSYRHSEGSIE